MPIQLQHITVRGLIDVENGHWDEEILHDICNERDKRLIKQVPIPMRRCEDTWFWLLEDKGYFTVRSCYRKCQGEYDCSEVRFWNRLWRLKLPGKVVNFLWRLCNGCLPVAEELVRRNVNLNVECPWCNRETESAIHVMFNCEFAKEVWSLVALQELIVINTSDTVFDVLKRVFNICNIEQCGWVGLFCWNLWNRRNAWVWNQKAITAAEVKVTAFKMLMDWKKAREIEDRHRSQPAMVTRVWTKPPVGWLKINCDAACDPAYDYIGVGCVIRDDQGRFLRARSKLIEGRKQPRDAEAYSLREALIWTKGWCNTRCLFELDAKLVVDACNGSTGSSYFHTIISDCIELSKHFEEVQIVFVHRSANKVVHSIARAAYSTSDLQEWLVTAPEFITCMLASEEV